MTSNGTSTSEVCWSKLNTKVWVSNELPISCCNKLPCWWPKTTQIHTALRSGIWSGLKLKVRWRAWAFDSAVKISTTPHPMWECLVQVLAPPPSQPPADAHPGRQQWRLKCVGLFHLHGRPDLSLVQHWPLQAFREWTNRRKNSISYLLSLSLRFSAFQVK